MHGGFMNGLQNLGLELLTAEQMQTVVGGGIIWDPGPGVRDPDWENPDDPK